MKSSRWTRRFRLKLRRNAFTNLICLFLRSTVEMFASVPCLKSQQCGRTFASKASLKAGMQSSNLRKFLYEVKQKGLFPSDRNIRAGISGTILGGVSFSSVGQYRHKQVCCPTPLQQIPPFVLLGIEIGWGHSSWLVLQIENFYN